MIEVGPIQLHHQPSASDNIAEALGDISGPFQRVVSFAIIGTGTHITVQAVQSATSVKAPTP